VVDNVEVREEDSESEHEGESDSETEKPGEPQFLAKDEKMLKRDPSI